MRPSAGKRALIPFAGYSSLLKRRFEEAIDILRPDISLNGVSRIRQMAAIAESYYTAIAPYHNGGPVASAAACVRSPSTSEGIKSADACLTEAGRAGYRPASS